MAATAALLPAFLLALSVFSCSRGGGLERVNLPPTPVLSIRSDWAVVKAPILRVREEPSIKSTLLTHIRTGAIIEIIAKSDREDTIEGETSFWYRINYEGLKGWVFGSYLEIFDTRSKAVKYADTLQ